MIKNTNETYYEATGKRISNISQLKAFNILQDTLDDTKFMNIFRSYRIDPDSIADIVLYDFYEVGNDEWWDNISYSIYGTPKLWWVLALINNVTNPFEELEEGTNIKILRSDYLYTLIKDMETIGSFE